MSCTKKISVFFLLGVFLFNSIGYFIVFNVEQYQIKKNVVAEINNGFATSLETIIEINKKDISTFVLNEKNQEISYKGKLYDVIKTVENKNSFTYHCIKDDAEETLFANLDEHINTNVISTKPTKESNSKNLQNNIVKLYYQNKFSFSFNTSISAFIFPSFNSTYTSRVISTNTPPPKFV